jgi:hypothetical protein
MSRKAFKDFKLEENTSSIAPKMTNKRYKKINEDFS